MERALPSESLRFSDPVLGALPNLEAVLEIANARLVPQVLEEPDVPWVQNLLPETAECTPDVLRRLSLYVARDIDLRTPEGRKLERREQAIQARHDFFGKILGWEHPHHTLSKTYDRLRKKTSFTPLRPFIDAQKVLHEAGVDNRKVLARYDAAVWTTAERYQMTMREMKRFALPVKLIEEAPQAFIPGGIGDRVKRLRQVGRAIGWNANVIEFVGSFPAVLTCTPQKIGVHALLFARSAQADLTPEQVCKRLTLPIDQHLRAVLREKRPDLMPFRPCPAAELLQASWVKKTLGKRIIDAYAAL